MNRIECEYRHLRPLMKTWMELEPQKISLTFHNEKALAEYWSSHSTQGLLRLLLHPRNELNLAAD
jgi:hypothetical protein